MTDPLKLNADIQMVKYTPFLCAEKTTYSESDLLKGYTDSVSSFYLKINNDKFAISRWVSPKRTRSYPYERVYNTLDFSGKRITLIPVVKDEGSDGDQDYLQWDTVSFMSLINVYVVPIYYVDAEKNQGYDNKITNQRPDNEYIVSKIKEIAATQQNALVWNLEQIKKLSDTYEKAIAAYLNISKKLGVVLHSESSKRKRLDLISKGLETFCNESRIRAQISQYSESHTLQPKELITDGLKAEITIANHLGGKYFFTCDEVKIIGNRIRLIEAKHSDNKPLPSLPDIKDALFKMILYVNLEYVALDKMHYAPEPEIKLTSDKPISKDEVLKYSNIQLLLKEAQAQRIPIRVTYNDELLN